MKIVFNSDVLYSYAMVREPYRSEIPKWLNEFCKEAEKQEHEIVIPTTTLKELQRIQKDDVQKVKTNLESAYSILKDYDLVKSDIDIESNIKEKDLVGDLRSSGINVKVEEPTIDDFKDAHTRACLKLPPHPPSKPNSDEQSDEMRDLVIWAMCVRFAKADGKAMLLSKDEIHTEKFGNEEAHKLNLYRFHGSNPALEFLHKETYAEKIIKTILKEAWTLLIDNLPFDEAQLPFRIDPKNFKHGKSGLSLIEGIIRIQIKAGSSLTGDLTLEFNEGILNKILIKNIETVNYNDIPDIEIESNVNIENIYQSGTSLAERKESLKSLF